MPNPEKYLKIKEVMPKESPFINIRNLTNLWTIITMAFFIIDFSSKGKYLSTSGAIGTIYITLLGLYAGSKELGRWTKSRLPFHSGESFIALWTLLMIVFVAMAILGPWGYKMPGEFITTYAAVLSIYVLTQRSKSMFNKKGKS